MKILKLIFTLLAAMAVLQPAISRAAVTPSTPSKDIIDASTLDHKLLFGYQGWFSCPGDGSPVNRWGHWFRRQIPVATNATIDFWPDVSELDPDERFATDMKLPNGTNAYVFSSFNQKTVVRHFKWMHDYHLDGVFLQRFICELTDPRFLTVRAHITTNVRLGAETYGRVFAIEYDISGARPETLVKTLTNDWQHLVTELQVTNSPRYLRHNGKPVIVIWGFGFTDRPGLPEEAQTVINYFKTAGLTVIGGVPSRWRTLTGDSKTDPAWANVYRSFDIVMPWMVGRFANIQGADDFKRKFIVPDLTETKTRGIGYMPVIFPGFSWHNLNGGQRTDAHANQTPRLGGTFYWHQMQNAVSAGCTTVFGAMFDEMDEGTAILKVAATPAQLPAQGTFVPLNIDGQNLPSDWYLRVAGEAARMLRGEIPVQTQLSIKP